MRPFTDEERLLIRKRLIQEGRNLFETYGIKKTNLDDLATSVGIAKSTFYQFFENKEALFLEVMEQVKTEVAERTLGQSIQIMDDPKEALETFFELVATEIQENPLVSTLYQTNELKSTLSHLSQDVLENIPKHRPYDILPYFQKWKEDGKIKADRLEPVIDALAFITIYMANRPVMNFPRFEETLDFFITLITNYLVEGEQSHK